MSDYFEDRMHEHKRLVAERGYPFEGDISEDQKSVWAGGRTGRWHSLETEGNAVIPVQLCCSNCGSALFHMFGTERCAACKMPLI